MKRNDIKAGVVYAIKGSYGPPSPIVFLEDGAAGLYGRRDYGRGPIRQLTENSYTKAKRGSGFSDSARGYAAMQVNGGSRIKDADAAEAMRAADPAAELVRFLADERPSADGLRFAIITSLNQIGGLYDEELAAYREAKRAADRRASGERAAIDARAARVTAAVEALSAYCIRAGGDTGGQVKLSVDEAEKLLDMLRDRPAIAPSET